MHKMDLRDFLKWAFAEELAHVATEGGGSWSSMASFAALGTVVDTFGSSGGLPEIANVHGDALKALEAVMMLASDSLDLPDDWKPFPDLSDPHGLIAVAVQEVMSRRALRLASDLNSNLIATVIALAVMGKEPEWMVAQPKFQPVTKPNGTPAWFKLASQTDAFGRVYSFETDGFDPKKRRPMQGAYQKFRIDGAFSGAVQARIDWYLWSGAMIEVFARLDGALKSHQIKPFAIDREPWKNRPNAQEVA
jgi:hypothetical protein